MYVDQLTLYEITLKRNPDSWLALSNLGSVWNEMRRPWEAIPFQIGFMQAIAVAETDAQAEELYGPHVEYFFRKALGSIPLARLMLPGGIDIKGPPSFASRSLGLRPLYEDAHRHLQGIGRGRMRDLRKSGDGPRSAHDAGARFPHRQSARHAAIRLNAEQPHEEEHRPVRRRSHASPSASLADEFAHYWWPEGLGGTVAQTELKRAEVA